MLPRGIPTFLRIEPIAISHCKGIIEDKDRSFEADAMFLQVEAVLLFVPLEAHDACPRGRTLV